MLTTSNYFLPTEPDAAQALLKKPTKPPPYTASEAQDVVTLAVVREFGKDATRSVGREVKEIYFGIGPEFSDPDAALLNRLSSSGLRIRPLSTGSLIGMGMPTTANDPSTTTTLPVALALESLDFPDYYTAIAICVWRVGGGPIRPLSYRFAYSSGRWARVQ